MIDVVLIAVVVLFIIVGFKRGVVRSLVEFVGSLFALVVSAMFSGWIADAICNVLKENRDFSMWEYALSAYWRWFFFCGVAYCGTACRQGPFDTIFSSAGAEPSQCGTGCCLRFAARPGTDLCIVCGAAAGGPSIEVEGHALSDETLAQSYLYGTVYSNSPAAGWFEQAEKLAVKGE